MRACFERARLRAAPRSATKSIRLQPLGTLARRKASFPEGCYGRIYVRTLAASDDCERLMTKSTVSTIAAAQTHDPAESCWSCGAMRVAQFCNACGKVQPPAPVNYFSYFGLPPKLNLDVTTLEKDFYQLSRKLHPDLNARAASKEQEWSLEQSSRLNDAYRTLKDPIKRTQYLLQIEGIQLEEQSKSANEQARASGEAKKKKVPPDLLEEVFELNMRLEELRMQKKMGEDDPALIEEVGRQKLELEEKRETL